jgi:hypothetical protein
MSEYLKAFLADWIKWVDGGAIDCEPFERRHGLCYCFEQWLEESDELDEDDQDNEIYALCDVFRADRLNAAYPFGGGQFFYEESGAEEMHLNPARIQWVRSKVAQFEVV